MKPLDPRLLRYARQTRVHLVVLVMLGAAMAGLVIAEAQLLAGAISAAFGHRATLHDLRGTLVALAGVLAARALVAWATQALSFRASAAVKSALRRKVLERAVALGPRWLAGHRTTELAALATHGIDSLDSYFAKYLPQLVLAVIVPVAVITRVGMADLVAGATIAVTVPLIPVFGALVGRAAGAHAHRRWRALTVLSHHFLDVVAGLPTLKVFGRSRAQARTIRAVTGDYRRATMSTLRLAFVSSLVLELLASLSVALVAVGIGLRLVYGHLDLSTGLLVLILAPEAYLPLRQAGAQFHASADGLAAAGEAFAVLETPAPAARPAPAGPGGEAGGGHTGGSSGGEAGGGHTGGTSGGEAGGGHTGGSPAPRPHAIEVAGLAVRHPGREILAPRGASLRLRAGTITAVTGPSGSGKSTLIAVVLGFVAPSSGRVVVEGPAGTATDLRELDPGSWRSQVSWVPQDPVLFAGTVADNISLPRPGAPLPRVAAAAKAAALGEVPLDRLVGERGSGLSSGQRRRVALARALLAERPVLLLDEPTAGLDAGTEADVITSLRDQARAGRLILIATHRPALLAAADTVAELSGTRPQIRQAHAFRPGGVRATQDPAALAGEPGRPAGEGRADQAGPGPGAAGERRAWWRARPPAGDGGRAAGGLALSALTGTLAAASAIGLLATSAWLISRAAEHPPVLALMVAVTAVRAFAIGRSVFRYTERLTGHDAALRILAGLRASAYGRLERLAPAGLAVFRSGDLVSRLVSDIDSLADRWLRVRLPYLVAGLTGAGAVAVSAAMLPAAGLLLALTLVAAAILAPLVAGLVSRRAERLIAPARGGLATAALDLLTGAGELIIFGAVRPALRQVSEADRTLARAEARSAAGRGLGAAVAAAAAGVAVWGTLAAGVPAVRSGTLAGVLLAVVVLMPLAVHEVYGALAPAAQELPRLRAAATRVSDMLSRPDPVHEPDWPAPMPGPPYHLSITGLTAGWPGGPDVLGELDLEVPAGRRVAVLGPSGSGKTTLAMVLLRFLEPRAGSVRLGGADITTLDSSAVRAVVGLCAQDAHIFDSTLAENLRLARPAATEGELREALRRSRLLEWTDSLPDGLGTAVGEHGARMSGGQRQRLALARVLLADFPVVILDEPTEHLDEQTAGELTRDLLAATEGKTRLLITHRPVDPAEVDQIVTLADPRTAGGGAAPWRPARPAPDQPVATAARARHAGQGTRRGAEPDFG